MTPDRSVKYVQITCGNQISVMSSWLGIDETCRTFVNDFIDAVQASESLLVYFVIVKYTMTKIAEYVRYTLPAAFR